MLGSVRVSRDENMKEPVHVFVNGFMASYSVPEG